MKTNGLFGAIVAVALVGALAGCTPAGTASAQQSSGAEAASSASAAVLDVSDTAAAGEAEAETASVAVASADGGVFQAADLFTDRDMEQSADTAGATAITVKDGEDVSITEEGVYVISGSASDVTIHVAADDAAKVQLVLDGVSISNETEPVIYVESADKVFVTTSADSSLTVMGTISYAADEAADAAVFSRSDLVLNGTGALTVSSTGNGVTSKDDLKVTGGTYVVTATGHALEANDSIAIADGVFTIDAGKDAIHADNDEDGTLGYVVIAGGTFDVTAASDGVHATSVAQIDAGTLNLASPEGVEATYVQVNGGDIAIEASDDGVNATTASTAYDTKIEFNGGNATISMAQGDTDALDTNGDLVITGGTIDITANSAFDFDGQSEFTGGTVTVNGEEVTTIENSMMGGMGGGMGGMGGQGGMGGRGPMGDMSGQGAQGGQA